MLPTTRSLSVLALSAGLVAPAILVATPVNAQPRAAISKPWLSPTGDIGTAVTKPAGYYQLGVSGFGDYFSAVRICVKNRTKPSKPRICRIATKTVKGDVYSWTARWPRDFARQGKGRYVVRYYDTASDPIGPLQWFDR